MELAGAKEKLFRACDWFPVTRSRVATVLDDGFIMAADLSVNLSNNT